MQHSSVEAEEHHFNNELDIDLSGYLDRREILYWTTISYEGVEIESEAAHLMTSADTEPRVCSRT